MKSINKEAAQIFNKMIALMNGEQSACIDNTEGTFMPVYIERLSSEVSIGGATVDTYSVAHYFKQAGDMVPDPEMTFAVHRLDPLFIFPMSFQNSLTYRESVFLGEDCQWKVRPREHKDQAIFAGQWMKNIKEQQNL